VSDPRGRLEELKITAVSWRSYRLVEVSLQLNDAVVDKAGGSPVSFQLPRWTAAQPQPLSLAVSTFRVWATSAVSLQNTKPVTVLSKHHP